MDLIKQLGGYQEVKQMWVGGGSLQGTQLAFELLEYRREHNIFEIEDWVVYEGEAGLNGLFKIETLTKTGKPKTVKAERFGNFPCRYCTVRHATDAEIKAGKRL